MYLVKRSSLAFIAVLIFLFFSAWWIYLNFINFSEDSNQRQLFAALYGFMALYGALWGVRTSRLWGGFSSLLGRSLLFFSLGLLLQEFGQIAYSFYIYFLDIEVPYPSWGDFGYFLSIPCYIFATYLLGRVAGARFSLRSIIEKPIVVFIPVVLLGASYYVFLTDYEFDFSNILRVLLDFGYPLGQSIYISFALIAYFLSRGVLGGSMKGKVLFVLFALIVQYVADYSFLWQFNQGEWVVGGLNDYVYLVSYFLMTLALIWFRNLPEE